jgi:ribonuclease E
MRTTHDDSDWDDLARELAITKKPASSPPPASEHHEPPEDSEEDSEEPEDTEELAEELSEEMTEEEAEFATPLRDSGESDENLDGEESAGGDDQSGTGRKRRRRRRRRRKGGQPGAAVASETGDADESTDEGGYETSYEDAPAEDAPAEDEPDTPTSAADAEEDTGGELLRDLIASWNVPSWDEIVGSLARPER